MKFKSKKQSKLEAAVAILSAADGERPTASDFTATMGEEVADPTAVATDPSAPPLPSPEEAAAAKAKREAAKAARGAEREEKRRLEMESKYPHVVPGSLRLVPKGEIVYGVPSKGRMVTVACIDCGAHRSVNIQDAFQSKRCRPCHQAFLKRRQKDRRAETKTKTTDAPEVGDGTCTETTNETARETPLHRE